MSSFLLFKVHPEAVYRKAAENVLFGLGHDMEVLNTNAGTKFQTFS